jgi:5-hydroxyisourate hydrolase-like protein (transthyretin family)
VLLLAVVAAALQGQSAVPAGVPGTIEGHVANAVTGEPVGGATVHLYPLGRRGGTAAQAQAAGSQADGVFRFESVSQGSYFLSAEAGNYVTVGGRYRAQRVAVASGQQITGIVVQLNPQGTISGRVLDENGQGVPGATVQAYTTYVMRGRLQLRRGTSVSAGKGGEFTLRKLNPGKYYISAEPERTAKKSHAQQKEQPAAEAAEAGDVSAPVVTGFVRTFYPSSLDMQSATPFEVVPGQPAADADIRLRRAITYQVSGRVGQTDGALRRATVLLSPRDTLDSNVLGTSARLADDGTFQVKDVLPGSYTLWLIGTYSPGELSPSLQGGLRLLGRQDIDVSASNVRGVVLSLTPPVNLSGHVTADGIDKQRLAQLRVNFVPAGQAMLGSFQSAAVDAEGNFALQNLAPGTYGVRVNNPPAGTYVKEVTYNRQDITASGLDVSLGGAGEIEVTIRSGAAEVDGTVQAEGGAAAGPGTIVVLIPEDIAADGYGTLSGPVSGDSFAIKNVPPGHYYAYALDHWDSVWQNADFLRDMQREGTSIEMEENARTQVQLPVINSQEVDLAATRLGLTAQ